MKIIDLFVKISKGEEVPKEIVYMQDTYLYNKDSNDYVKKGTLNYWLFKELFAEKCTEVFINDEVEVIEEDNRIEKVNLYYHVPNAICDEMVRETLCDIIENQRIHEDKINELIEEVNKLKGEK